MRLWGIDWLSGVILLLLAIDFIVGFRRGLIRQVFDLLGIVLALLAAIKLGPSVAGSFVAPLIPAASDQALSVLGFVVVFLAVLAVMEVASHGIGLIAKVPGLSVINGLGGALFRVARGAILISIVLSLIVALEIPAADELVRDSAIAQTLQPVAGIFWSELKDYIPGGLGIPDTGGGQRVEPQPAQPGGGRSI